jgi:hypothetical protein
VGNMGTRSMRFVSKACLGVSKMKRKFLKCDTKFVIQKDYFYESGWLKVLILKRVIALGS